MWIRNSGFENLRLCADNVNDPWQPMYSKQGQSPERPELHTFHHLNESILDADRSSTEINDQFSNSNRFDIERSKIKRSKGQQRDPPSKDAETNESLGHFSATLDIGRHPITFPFYEGYKNVGITFAPVRIRVAMFNTFWWLLLGLHLVRCVCSSAAAVVLAATAPCLCLCRLLPLFWCTFITLPHSSLVL